MNIEQIEQQIADLQAQAEKLKAEKLKAEKEKEWPQIGDYYWCAWGNWDVNCYRFCGDAYDAKFFAMDNAFRTEAEALSVIESRKVVAELRRQPGRKKFVAGEHNYCIEVNFEQGMVWGNFWYSADMGWHSIYFDSDEAAEAAIKAVGKDRILKAAKWFAMGEVWK